MSYWIPKETKKCHWCGKEKPFYEHGSWELDPETEETIGWICNFCIARFEGWDDKPTRRKVKNETYNNFATRYNESHPENPLEIMTELSISGVEV